MVCCKATLLELCHLPLQVWIVHKPESIAENYFKHRNQSQLSLQDVLAMPRTTPVKCSSSGWWNTPGPCQPVQYRVWNSLHASYDPTAATVDLQTLPHPPETAAGAQQLGAAVESQAAGPSTQEKVGKAPVGSTAQPGASNEKGL